jgi:hypothetical protein
MMCSFLWVSMIRTNGLSTWPTFLELPAELAQPSGHHAAVP